MINPKNNPTGDEGSVFHLTITINDTDGDQATPVSTATIVDAL